MRENAAFAAVFGFCVNAYYCKGHQKAQILENQLNSGGA